MEIMVEVRLGQHTQRSFEMYKLINDPRTNETCAIEIIGANTSFPLDPANTDYQEYLKWLAEGNVPLPAEIPDAD